jgi:hypothetical protein
MPKKRWQDGDKCTMPTTSIESGSVHPHHDGTWWFWDETGCQEFGPFGDHTECLDRFRNYRKQL